MPTRWIIRLETLLSTALVLGVLGALAALAGTVAIAFFGVPHGIGIPLTVFDVPTAGMTAGGATVDDVTAEVTVHPNGASPLGGLLHLLMWAPGAVTVLLALFAVVRALRRARSGDRALFSAVTARHLRTLGWTLIVGSLVSGVLGSVAQTILSAMLLTERYPFYAPPGEVIGGVVAGMAALGVSEIVRRGLALLEEVEATI
ncbi:DUF2975 domain-containing protein [Nonomuraea gerenzanensis]|uniref:DUF2975 domain-containing protein n=1 Tax=Nonomuraea gerenzanensis TaxID=93944 RepID=A0A1M4E6X3_9ACTN|nr:DUF2975 domain-containing protein [Nonomuraea gerenzanensis]UBU16891.1 DUF2975 domain-containing protein [Nonomuraea gerenzanensis]SBO94607.1 hypothetical protein BN4615_P4123 [Nonomuraea gerenzanensis]